MEWVVPEPRGPAVAPWKWWDLGRRLRSEAWESKVFQVSR